MSHTDHLAADFASIARALEKGAVPTLHTAAAVDLYAAVKKALSKAEERGVLWGLEHMQWKAPMTYHPDDEPETIEQRAQAICKGMRR